MKILIACFALLALSCGKSSSKNKTNKDSKEIQAMVIKGDAPAPTVGVYLGQCQQEGDMGVASGVEVTTTQIFPVTVVFGDRTCAPSTMTTWGYTGNFNSFANYANYLGTRSKQNGDEVSSSFTGTTIVFASDSGSQTVLNKTDVALYSVQRLQISLYNESIDANAKSITTNVSIQNSIFADHQWELAFYCEHEGKLLRQDSYYERTNGEVTLSAWLNTWNQDQVEFPARCQASLALRHGNDGSARTDLAYSQFVTIP